MIDTTIGTPTHTPFGVTESGTTGTLRMHDALEDLGTAMARMDGDERERFARGVLRALNVYITQAKFEVPNPFNIPAEFPMPKAPEPTPAPPRGT